MISSASCSELITAEQHNRLWQWVQSRYGLHGKWYTLYLNDMPLGRLNPNWLTQVKKDWQGSIAEFSDGIGLYADSWLALADSLQHLAFEWKQIGLLKGWRDEKFNVFDSNGEALFALERAAFRPFGLQSNAVHLNGITKINGKQYFWISKRSAGKAVDPNKFDNLVGGGIASDESVLHAMLREAEEEAGLTDKQLDNLAFHTCLHSIRPVSRGLHDEILHIFNIELPNDVQPENQDGEVASFQLMSIPQILQAMLSHEMMDDAQIVLLSAFQSLNLLRTDHPLTNWLNSIQTSPRHSK